MRITMIALLCLLAADLPATRGRHFTLTLIDTAGEVFASFGSRTGEDAGQIAGLVGPAWCGELPHGLKAKRAPRRRASRSTA